MPATLEPGTRHVPATLEPDACHVGTWRLPRWDLMPATLERDACHMGTTLGFVRYAMFPATELLCRNVCVCIV